MKRLIATSALALVVLGCSRTSALILRLEMDTTDATQKQELLAASLRVLDRKSGVLGTTIADKKVTTGEGGTTMLEVELTTPGMNAALVEFLTVPFTMRLMREAKAGETTDATVEGHGGFKDTGLTEQHLVWVQAETSGETGKGGLIITFNPEGQELIKKVYAENKGKSLGLFVGNRLVSKLSVTGDPRTDIVITDVPSPKLAEIFADDVNVGRYVKWVPAQ